MATGNIKNPVICVQLKVTGIVQGVGFRTFVKNLADREGIAGSVCNRGPYVEIISQGCRPAVRRFRRLLLSKALSRAEILGVEAAEKPLRDGGGFFILESAFDRGEVLVPPDIAVCDDCRRELFDPGNRRYLHPFINCTACGLRMTIHDSMPYDRERTSMRGGIALGQAAVGAAYFSR